MNIVCSVDGCSNKVKGGTGLCALHYMRKWRNGVTDLIKKSASTKEHSQGYILTPSRGHPLSNGRSHDYEHRIIYYDAHGKGPFNCKWCAKQVTWMDLHIDHLDDDRKNNNLTNLVVSCAICNQQRGRHKAADTWRRATGIKALGMIKTLSEWSRYTGISRAALRARLDNGWTPDKAMITPRGKFGPKSGKSNWDMTDWRGLEKIDS